MPAHRHTRRCFGCSETTGRSLGIELAETAHCAEGRVRFDRDHVGAPGLVHGGLLATLADEVMGTVSHGGDGLRLTASLTMRYRKPTPLETDLVCRARLGECSGRRYTVVADITTADDPVTVLAEAEATYILMEAEGLDTNPAAK